jgi:hypothetical protein
VQGEIRKSTAILLLATLVVASIPMVEPVLAFPSSLGGLKPLTLFFHYAASAESAGGVSTNYLASTAAAFQNVKNHDVKAVGQPKLKIDFYTFPAFAGPVHLSANWQVVIFANSTALHPATWNLEFWEKSSVGTIMWDSGALSPSVLGGPSGNSGYVDAPIYGYTLTASNLNHTFASGDTLEVEITVNAGATVPLSLWYDSAQQPSSMILPSSDYMRISGVSTSDANGTLRTVFFTFWSADQRNVTIRTAVKDPFGGYDIHDVLVSVEDPAGAWLVSNSSMKQIAGTAFSYNSSYSYSLAYASGSSMGNYTVYVMALDNNADNQFMHTGSYFPFADVMSTQFSIGIQYPVHVRVVDMHEVPLVGAKISFFSGNVEYAAGVSGRDGTYNVTLFTGDFVAQVSWEGVIVLDQNVSIRGATTVTLTAAVYYPTFRFVDDANHPLAGALVFVHFPNGSASLLPYTTDSQAMFILSQQPKGNYIALVLFEGVAVADTSVRVLSDGPFVVPTTVFQLRVTVEDRSGAPLNDSSVLVSSPGKANGGPYGFLLTGKNGEANFSLPVGNYVVTAEYHGEYLLSGFSNRTSIDITLNHDLPLVIKMTNLPPPIWLTLGFQLVVAVVLVAVSLSLYILLGRRNRVHR